MPTTSVIIGAGAGALIGFLSTAFRGWWRRRRLAREAASRLSPHLDALSDAVADALATYSWRPLDRLDLTDHSLPRLTSAIINGSTRRAAEPVTDGVLAVQELERARESVALAAPQERDRIESYRRRIDTASAIVSAMAAPPARRPSAQA